MIADTVSIGRVLDIQLVVDEQTNKTDKRNMRRIDSRQIVAGHVRVQINYLFCQCT